ncbi:uncharacterized protein LOC126366671 [Pectinophora gossypiella]|uniref:uncharacterized protein LOC126366671 n=1 Tax=Pectinophora gossypiella TaxID=13191 RepID=UPI00214EA71A|nr:uncharacterized protein LOC126366671 [Pectinophora gossypiella]
MGQHYLFGFMIVITCFFLEAASRPSNNESSTSFKVEVPVEDLVEEDQSEETSLPSEEYVAPQNENTKEILEKIKAINERLKKPHHRQQTNYNAPPYANGGYVLDKAILEKIQQMIASGKLHGVPSTQKDQESNTLTSEKEDNESREGNSRALRYVQQALTSNSLSGQPTIVPLPYVTSIPVVVMPNVNGLTGYSTTNVNGLTGYPASNDLSLQTAGEYLTRQGPSLPFNIQWPLAPFFPVLLKDPLLHYLQGGTWQNLIEYGQSADVCNRKQKSTDVEPSINEEVEQENDEENQTEDSIYLNPVNIFKSRQGRARKLKKRTIPKSTPLQLTDVKGLPNIFAPKPVTTKPVATKPVKKVESLQSTKHAADEGDLRFPFSDFTWFGNRKPVAPSPGFFINRLKVRRGGVAIAGPGGVATAGRGGTAIVGPGGLAYTQPGGLAVAGPAARIVALSPDTDLNSVVTRLHEQSASGWGRWRDWRRFGRQSWFDKDEYYYDGYQLVREPVEEKPTFTLFIKPEAHATNAKGVAIANPVSYVVLTQGRPGSIVHAPVASAVVGPGGIAHAQSDLGSLRVQYLPFYGGAKGQYLEVKQDTAGTVVSEKIVSEENISSENIVKNTEENLLAKVLGANLQNLKTLSSSVLKLHNLGRKTGSLGNNEKARFKSELSSLGETASNTIKLIEEIGDNVDILFKSNASKRQYQEEDVGEEGVGIDNAEEEPSFPLEGAIIAEAKPVGLAVVGEQGLAASRPHATAVASSGIAIARPVGTAIAGIDPTLLGIDFNVNKS